MSIAFFLSRKLTHRDLKRYGFKKYKDNYLKYPGSEDKNSWDVLSKHLIKQGQT